MAIDRIVSATATRIDRATSRATPRREEGAPSFRETLAERREAAANPPPPETRPVYREVDETVKLGRYVDVRV